MLSRVGEKDVNIFLKNEKAQLLYLSGEQKWTETSVDHLFHSFPS